MNFNLTGSMAAGLVVVSVVLAVTSGCAFLKPARSESHYYLLTSEHADQAPIGHRGSHGGYVVRVPPVDVANYLENQSVAVREGTNEVHFDLFHQWAEPLDQGIRRVLAEDLRTIPGIGAVLTDQSPPTNRPVYLISVQVLACEGVEAKPEGAAEFKAVWEIAREGSEQAALARGIFRSPPLPWHPGDYGELAAKLSQALSDFSRILAHAVSGNHQNRGSP